MNTFARINEHVEVTLTYGIKCPSCEVEYELCDSIDGKMFKGQDYMHCAACGGLISLVEKPVKLPEAVNG